LNLDKYFPPRDVVTHSIAPTTITVDGEQYILASAGQQQQSGTMAVPDNVLQHHMPSGVINYNGQPHVVTPTGIMPYAAQSSTIYPTWTRSAYTRGLGLFAGAAILGVFLLCLGIALYALVTIVIANAFAVGMAIVAIFMGGLVLLSALTRSRHGYDPRRR
jgi:hypothetical protein